jgi:4-amino-4-deoxy-L-arabinose transferase-like glycosyltransferase
MLAKLIDFRTRHPVWALIGIAALARVLAVSVRFVIGTDEGLFLTLGRSLADGLGYTGDGRTLQVDFPPGFPLFAALVYALGGWPELPSQLNVLVIGSLIVVPVYWLGRHLVTEQTGFRAGLFAALLPALALAQANFEAVAEPLYNLVFYTGWALLWRGLTRREAWTFGLAGLALGAAHLVRWEAVILGGTGAGLIVLGLWRRREAEAPAQPTGAARYTGARMAAAGPARQPPAIVTHKLRSPLAAGVLFLAGLLVCAAPYAAYLYSHTGSILSPKTRITLWHAAALDQMNGDPFAYEKAYDAYEAFLNDPRTPLAVQDLSLAETARRYAGNLALEARLWLTSVSLMTVVWIVPALAGAAGLPRRRALFLVIPFLPLGLIPLSVMDPRYFLPALPAAMLLAATGWSILDDYLPVARFMLGGRSRRWPLATMLVGVTLALFAAGSLAGPFLAPRPTEYRTAGLALRGAVPEGAHILARKRQVPFYAEAYWEWLPYGTLDEALAYARAHGAEYLALDEATTPSLRPQLAHLLDPTQAPPGLDPIYHSSSGPRVVVYRIEAR